MHIRGPWHLTTATAQLLGTLPLSCLFLFFSPSSSFSGASTLDVDRLDIELTTRCRGCLRFHLLSGRASLSFRALSSRFAQCVIHNMLSPNLALTLASQIPNHGFCALRHLGRFRFSPLGCWRRFNFDVDRMESSKCSHEHGVIAE